MKKFLTIILLLCFLVGCSVSNKSNELTNPPMSNEISLNTIVSAIPTEPAKKTFNYTAQEGDTFFSIAVSLYPDKDLSAAADTLKKLNPNPIKPGDIIICPETQDIPEYYIVIAYPSGAFENSAYYKGAKSITNTEMENINQELGIETTDFLVVRCQGVNKYFPVGKDADKVLYAYQKDDKWGLINGLAMIVMEPTHAMVTTLGYNMTSHYLVSENKEKPFSGLLYTVDGEKVFDFEVGLIGGGPDCDSAHIRRDVFTYEENGKLGLVTLNQEKVTPAVYDFIGDDYQGAFMYALKDNITYFLTTVGQIPTPDIPDLTLMGVTDDVISEYSYARNVDTNVITVYKGMKAVFETQYYIEQIEGGFLEYAEDGINTYDLNFDKLHCFPKEYTYLLEGPEGAYSYSGYMMFEKDEKYILCTKTGKELISTDEWFYAMLEDDYLRISTDGSLDMLYDLAGNFVKEAEKKREEYSDSSPYIFTAFYNDNSYYRRYYTGWIEFVTEDFEYTFPYSTEEYFATHYERR